MYISRTCFILCATLLISLSTTDASIWEWVWSNKDENNSPPPKIDQITLRKVPYEAKTEDEKFLEEAKKFTGLKLSELDSCQHKVILKIKTSCTDLSEDELAKLSVNLLNCQSAVEGRQQFTCTEDMTLRQCTSSMDSDMWNTYHLMSNRARAVCYHTRQQQFRVLSQMTVDKLMNSAHDQIRTMNSLKEGQEKLEVMTAGAMDTVAAGQEALLSQQERMKVTHQNLKDFVSHNLVQLVREKALIAAGHQQLSKLTADIGAKLDAASSQLVLQTSEQRSNHQELLNDLKILQDQARTIWEEIEHSNEQILLQQQSTVAHYDDTLQKLAKINDTVFFLMGLMETTKQELDERLGWLGAVVGAAGIYIAVLHVLYLLLGMIASAFLHVSTFTKLVLVLLVPANLVAIYHSDGEVSLSFFAMTVLIVLSVTVQWFVLCIQTYVAARKQNRVTQAVGNGFPPMPVHIPRTSLVNLWSRFKSWLFVSPSVPSQPQHLKHSDYEDDASDADESEHQAPSVVKNFSPFVRQRLYHGLPTPSRTPSRSESPIPARSETPRPVCRAMCRTGLMCRNLATPGSDQCRIHSFNSSFHQEERM